MNNLVDEENETLAQFGQRLRPRNLILDLRHSNGGPTQLYPELLRTLVAFSRATSSPTWSRDTLKDGPHTVDVRQRHLTHCT
ncbi:MAG TPA: hypothetical protein VF006_08715 [Longimicrobium sp.]